jgi:DNA-binding NarL/FixJ family response regulator
MNKPKTSVLLVDDHELVRQGIRRVLDGHYFTCGEAVNGEEAIEKSITLKPDVVILDVSMPVVNGLDAARQIRAAVPATKIVLLSMHDSPHLEEEAKASGADAFLSKTSPSSQLLGVIEQLVRATEQDSESGQTKDDLINEKA